MASKYTIHCGYMLAQSIFCDSWEDVKATIVRNKNEDFMSDFTVTGEGYDCDCDQDGFHVISTGLTDEEQEEIDSL